MELKRVVVTGLGAITPLGNDVETVWKNAVDGVSGAGPITNFDASLFKTQFACEVKDFNPADYLLNPDDRRELKDFKKYDKYTQFALAASKQAVDDSKLLEGNTDLNEVGVIVASGIGGLHTFEEQAGYYATHPELGPKYSPFFIPTMIADIAAGIISIKYGFRGPNYGVVSACATSTTAMIDAFNQIRMGKAVAMVTGGSEASVYPAGVGGFNSMHALSTRNDEPQAASRPFSASRDGFVMGEGAVVLVFEELEHALARGAKIYGEVIGGGMSADAYHLTATHPEGLGAKLVMKRAIEDAGIKPEDVDYVNVHGTSTPVGDVSEAKAIADLFGEHAYKLNISSTKSMTGHMLGATGAMEALFCVKACQDDIVPPTINHNEDDKDEKIDYNMNFTFNKAQKRTVNVALSNTFGFGGHNASIIVKKYKD
ncbi:MAG: beta-ketoacyl-ACP synthase II [Muribaculaceae bacterium]|nr:beta-ketoacyl-ACP synthase II [Muribaculaceae bacterium]